MKAVLALTTLAAFAWPQETDATKDAIAAVHKAHGKVTIDESRPGRLVTGVDI